MGRGLYLIVCVGAAQTFPSANPYNLPADDLKLAIERGRAALVEYPVTATVARIPYEPFKNFLSADSTNPLKAIFLGFSNLVFKIKDLASFYNWLGLAPFNENEKGIYNIPKPRIWEEGQPTGITLLQSDQGVGLTFGCLTCHASQFMGRTVMGLPNKQVRANKLFAFAKRWAPVVPAPLFQLNTGATDGETAMFAQTKWALQAVQAQTPLALGLDTSLSQVGRSLSTRTANEWADRNIFTESFPRAHSLDHLPADSKPATWWVAKYKNHWLSDGSLRTGNPVFTNILWNEIGRGIPLHDLDSWVEQNQQTIQDMTTALMNTASPKWEDFFPGSSIKLASAQRGENLFNQNCMHCHGTYAKDWERGLKTVKVIFPIETPTIDVGTDPARWKGMEELSTQLNPLAINKKNHALLIPQRGYVPPPLEGIFLRYPYLHNNSVPSLCALLSLPNERPQIFYQGPAKTLADYDTDCVGYPTGPAIPPEWKIISQAQINTYRVGLSNQGHDRMLVNPDGTPRYTPAERMDLVEFLKTL